MTGRDRAPLVAVITGASRGLGAGMAEAWARGGMALGLCARTVPDPPAGPDNRVVVASVDVADAAAVDRFARVVVERFGRIDLWVNNAGVLDPIGPLAELDAGAVRRHMDVNVLGVAHGSAAFARHVRSRPGGGVLVNVSSGAATRPSVGWAPYCASKAAVEMLTEVVAIEERAHGLSAYALSPGVVDTDMQEQIRSTPEERFPSVERYRRLAESGAFNSPEWVGSFILEELVGGTDATEPAAEPGLVRRRVPDQG